MELKVGTEYTVTHRDDLVSTGPGVGQSKFAGKFRMKDGLGRYYFVLRWGGERVIKEKDLIDAQTIKKTGHVKGHPMISRRVQEKGYDRG